MRGQGVFTGLGICCRVPRMKMIRTEAKRGSLSTIYFFGVLSALVLIQAVLPCRFQVHCLFKQWTGYPCITCGATRCVQLLLKGSWGTAFQMQPLVFCCLLFFGAGMLYSAAAVFFRWPVFRLQFESRGERIAAGVSAGFLILANWAYLISQV